MASNVAMQRVAQAWCVFDPDKPELMTSGKEMDIALATAMADILDGYIYALAWCGGSPDFGPGGKAEQGWAKVAQPLLLDWSPDHGGE